MTLTIDMFYGIVAAICAIVITITLNRNLRSNKIDRIDNALLTFFVLYCVVDGAWGLVNSRTLFESYLLSNIFVYAVYTLEALVTFAWFRYIFHYINVEQGRKRIILYIDIVVLIAQLILLVLNIFNKNLFEIDIVTSIYHPYDSRYLIYYLQLLLEVIALVYILFKLPSKKSDLVSKKLYQNALFYLLIMITATLGQMYVPNLCFFSLGLMMLSFALAPINNEEPIIITQVKETRKEVKDRLKQEAENELKLAQLIGKVTDSVSEIYSVNIDTNEYKVFDSDTQSFKDDKLEKGFFEFFLDKLKSDVHDEEYVSIKEKFNVEKINESFKEKDNYIVEFLAKDGEDLKRYSIRTMKIDSSENKAIVSIYDEHKRIVKKIVEVPKKETKVVDKVETKKAPVKKTAKAATVRNTKSEVKKKPVSVPKPVKVTLDTNNKPHNIIKENEDLCEMMKNLADLHNIKFVSRTVRVKNENVIYDLDKLNKILTNVINNAIKYSNEGSKVTYILEEISCKDKTKAKFKFSIKDNGVGMSEKFLNHIYDEYSKEENSLGKNGIGLGMYVVRNLIDRIDGDISINSKQGVGTSVTITTEFELTEPKATKSDSESVNNIKGKRVLLVEDNEEYRNKIIEVLEKAEILYDIAKDGRNTVDKVVDSANGYYVAVILGTEVTVFDQFDTTAKIRKADAINNRYIPIIGITEKATYDNKNSAKKVGMDEYLSISTVNNKLVSKIAENVK